MVSPGLVNTEILVTGGIASDGDPVMSMPALNPDDVADAVIYSLSTPPMTQVKD